MKQPVSSKRDVDTSSLRGLSNSLWKNVSNFILLFIVFLYSLIKYVTKTCSKASKKTTIPLPTNISNPISMYQKLYIKVGEKNSLSQRNSTEIECFHSIQPISKTTYSSQNPTRRINKCQVNQLKAEWKGEVVYIKERNIK